MPFAWFAALRYLRTDKAQTALVLAAVSVGVSVIVFLSALIGGLQASLLDKTLGSQPHVTLRRPREAPRALARSHDGTQIAERRQPSAQRLRSIDQWPAAVRAAEGLAGVTATSPLVTGAGFALHGAAREPIVLRGIDPERFLAVTNLTKKLVEGRLDVTSGNVAVGAELAENLGVGIGDKLTLTTSEGSETLVTIDGVFRSGNEGVDRSWVLTSLRHAQALFGLPGGVTSIELTVADVFAAEAVARELGERTGLDAVSWMQQNADLLRGLSAQASSKSLIQFFVVVAVALGIASVLIVSVVQKSREIGILRAVGTPARRILALFLVQGGLLGFAGSAVGSLLGALFARGFEHLAVGPDGQPRFPVLLEPSLFVRTSLLAIGIGLLAAVLPAVRAARLDPASAIRHV